MFWPINLDNVQISNGKSVYVGLMSMFISDIGRHAEDYKNVLTGAYSSFWNIQVIEQFLTVSRNSIVKIIFMKGASSCSNDSKNSVAKIRLQKSETSTEALKVGVCHFQSCKDFLERKDRHHYTK